MSRNLKKKLDWTMLLFIIILSILILLLSGCSTQNKLDLSCDNCNVIFFNVELLRADHVGLINNEYVNTTPNIDKFFAHSIIFDDVTSPVGETTISNIATLTNTDAFFIREIVQAFYYSRRELKNYSKDPTLNILNSQDMMIHYKTIGEILQDKHYYTIQINEGTQTGH